MTAAKWDEVPVYENLFSREMPEVRKAFNLLVGEVNAGRVDEKHEKDLEVALVAAQILAQPREKEPEKTFVPEETIAAAIVDIGLRMRTSEDIPRFEKILSKDVMAVLTDDTIYRITKPQDFIHAQTGIRQAFAAAAIVLVDNMCELLLEQLQTPVLANSNVPAQTLVRMQLQAHLTAGPVMPFINRLESPDLERVFVENMDRFITTMKTVPKPKIRDPGAYGAN